MSETIAYNEIRASVRILKKRLDYLSGILTIRIPNEHISADFHFDMDGPTLVFSRDGKLFLRVSSGDVVDDETQEAIVNVFLHALKNHQHRVIGERQFIKLPAITKSGWQEFIAYLRRPS